MDLNEYFPQTLKELGICFVYVQAISFITESILRVC